MMRSSRRSSRMAPDTTSRLEPSRAASGEPPSSSRISRMQSSWRCRASAKAVQYVSPNQRWSPLPGADAFTNRSKEISGSCGQPPRTPASCTGNWLLLSNSSHSSASAGGEHRTKRAAPEPVKASAVMALRNCRAIGAIRALTEPLFFRLLLAASEDCAGQRPSSQSLKACCPSLLAASAISTTSDKLPAFLWELSFPTVTRVNMETPTASISSGSSFLRC
mmetsp:Transcript_40920/g.95060  ORF Transcript_40920/g.95060 Transcript_40920/m.95060 type:complete len:221 (+) Transcript_40920:327-989(+)